MSLRQKMRDDLDDIIVDKSRDEDIGGLSVSQLPSLFTQFSSINKRFCTVFIEVLICQVRVIAGDSGVCSCVPCVYVTNNYSWPRAHSEV